jgi:hypothetical protein
MAFAVEAVAVPVGSFAVTSEGLSGLSGLEVATGRKFWRALDIPAGPSAVLTVHPSGQLLATNLYGELLGLDVGQSLVVRWRSPFPLLERPRAVAVRGDTIHVIHVAGVRTLLVSRR